MTCESSTFYLAAEGTSLEPLFNWERRSFLHSETTDLLQRYRHLTTKFPATIGQLFVIDKRGSAYGIPQEIPTEADAVVRRMDELKISESSLSLSCGIPVAELKMRPGERPGLPLSAFVNVATALELDDFNSLVGKVRWATAKPATEDELRVALHAADRVRFAFCPGFSESEFGALREAASDLHASCHVKTMNRAGQVDAPLNHAVFSSDAAEFLAVAYEQGSDVRFGIEPFFERIPPDVLPEALRHSRLLPAVGRQVVLLLRARAESAARRLAVQR